MLESLISFFAKRHLLSNFIFIGVLIGGVLAWQNAGKEEMPDVTFDTIRISVRYAGATAAEVENLVTRPIEEVLRGLDGIYRITSTSSMGSSSIAVELDQDYPDKKEAFTEIRTAALDVRLPDDVIDEPSFRQFKTSTRPIIDIALYKTGQFMLDFAGREELQNLALALETRLISLTSVNSINRSGYTNQEIHIEADPDKLVRYSIPFNTVMREVRNNNVRQPAGSLKTVGEPRMTFDGELSAVESLRRLPVQGGFEGNLVRLEDVALVTNTFEDYQRIIKVNGNEAVILNVVKNSSAGILETLDRVREVVERFKVANLQDSPINVVLLDDESVDLRNRLSLIKRNGSFGFILVIIMLIIFLDMRSALWVAMGIPFTFGFTIIAAYFLGYTINNITLAAVIIVMGMVVDDAIVVAENINRTRLQSGSAENASVKGAAFVFLPVVASIVTTCVAFIPLYFFSGRFARMIVFIPPIIFLMLGGSLFESLLILPGHMELSFGRIRRFVKGCFVRKRIQEQQIPADSTAVGHWFERTEDAYGNFLEKILPYKFLIFFAFIFLMAGSLYIFKSRMKFVMFPHEETREIRLDAEAARGTGRLETEELARQIEAVLMPYIGKEVIGFRTGIAQSHRGGAVEENKLNMGIEIIPREKRKKAADQLIKEWEGKLAGIQGFEKITFAKSRWGQASGSPIVIEIRENNDARRAGCAEALTGKMRQMADLKNVEIEEPLKVTEYRLIPLRDRIRRLGINPGDIGSTLRAILEGTVLYEIPGDDVEIPVRFSSRYADKGSVERVLSIPVENARDYLVPLKDIVRVEKTSTPLSIQRYDLKRVTTVFADMAPGTKLTPLDIADTLESGVFPELLKNYPTSIIAFGGEIKDSRESQADFALGTGLVIIFIYIVLALLFNSIFKPLLIMMAIPFGVVGVILAFWLHGKTQFGFFGCIGALGLAGVVINDSIVMLVKLDKEFSRAGAKILSNGHIARIAQTRLKAVILTTLTTVAGLMPTAYGFAGYDALLAQMMLAMAWGLMFGTCITLVLIPSLYSLTMDMRRLTRRAAG
ncbi:MAG: efflux RND transporter permease subunit [bacterium]